MIYKYIFYFFVLIFLNSSFSVYAKDQDVSVSKLTVLKRNKPSCDRVGNVYDACQWMVKFRVKNNTNSKLDSFCFKLKVNKKAYELCYGKKKKVLIQSGKYNSFLINLTELFGISQDSEKPSVRILIN